jgi:hypothetical protein
MFAIRDDRDRVRPGVFTLGILDDVRVVVTDDGQFIRLDGYPYR